MDDGTVDNGGAADAGTLSPTEGKWFDGFSDEIKSDPSITKFESAETLAKSYINAQQLIGRDKIPMPLTAEDWDNTYSRLGRPASPDQYEFNIPEGAEGDDSWFREIAHKAGLNTTQALLISDTFYDLMQEQSAASEVELVNASEQLVDDLRKEWGSAYDTKVAAAQRGILEFADESFLEYLDNSGLGNDPRLIKIFSQIGETLTGDSNLVGAQSPGVTAIEIDTAISQIQSNKAYTDRMHPEHKTLVKQMEHLMGEKYG